ncbi:HD-GYP domain-containing protein [Paenibacillus swuensis]|uniref:HD-GYP domain-containing protein n=1 Tax=Paenibacillus swuensis TaxID=1178515 RepID=UPI0008384085|nr:HD domain-containing phosphohydrolase [Paenibacillus swuensis]
MLKLKLDRWIRVPVPRLIFGLWTVVTAIGACLVFVYGLIEGAHRDTVSTSAALAILIVVIGLGQIQRNISASMRERANLTALFLFLIMGVISVYSPIPAEYRWIALLLFPLSISVLFNSTVYRRWCAFFILFATSCNFIELISLSPDTSRLLLTMMTRFLFAGLSIGLGAIVIISYQQSRGKLEADYLELQKEQVINLLQCFIPVGERKTQTSRQEITNMSNLLTQLATRHDGLQVQKWEIDLLSLLHFVSRVKLPDYMFEKEGKLSDFELEVVQEHCYMAKELCEDIPGLQHVKTVFLYHHEKVDGTGYPAQLRGDQIPELSQMLGLVEVFLAMTTPRSYRQPMTEAEAYREIQKLSGTSFRADIVETFGRMIS